MRDKVDRHLCQRKAALLIKLGRAARVWGSLDTVHTFTDSRAKTGPMVGLWCAARGYMWTDLTFFCYCWGTHDAPAWCTSTFLLNIPTSLSLKFCFVLSNQVVLTAIFLCLSCLLPQITRVILNTETMIEGVWCQLVEMNEIKSWLHFQSRYRLIQSWFNTKILYSKLQ